MISLRLEIVQSVAFSSVSYTECILWYFCVVSVAFCTMQENLNLEFRRSMPSADVMRFTSSTYFTFKVAAYHDDRVIGCDRSVVDCSAPSHAAIHSEPRPAVAVVSLISAHPYCVHLKEGAVAVGCRSAMCVPISCWSSRVCMLSS